MNTVSTKQLDAVLGHVRILQYGIDTLLSDPSCELKQAIGALTDYFNDLETDSHHFGCRKLDKELCDWFIHRTDPKATDRFGDYLIRIYLSFIKPLKNSVEEVLDVYNDQNYSLTLSGPELKLMNENKAYSKLIYRLVKRWTWAIYATLDNYSFMLSKGRPSVLDEINLFDEFDTDLINTSSKTVEAKFSTHFLKRIIELERPIRASFYLWLRLNKKGACKPFLEHLESDQILSKEGIEYDLAENLGREIEDCFFSISHSELHKSYARILTDTIHDLYSTRKDLDINEYERINPSDQPIQINPMDTDGFREITSILHRYETVITKKLIVFAPSILWRNVDRYRFSDPNTPTDSQFKDSKSDLKLTWNCKPAVAGYIISELIRAGYLEPTVTNRELSYAKLGMICKELFSFNDHSPTAESWRKVLNPDSNTLPDNKRIKLRLPDRNELG